MKKNLKKEDLEKIAKAMNVRQGDVLSSDMLKSFLRAEKMYYNKEVIRLMKMFNILYMDGGLYSFNGGIHWTMLSNILVYYRNGNFVNKRK